MRKQRLVRGVPVEESSGNVYADLGYADSEGMLVKAQLAAKIAEIVHRRGLTQARAAEILGLTQPKVSAVLRGRFRGISEHRLLECLTRLGRDVHIVIKPTPGRRPNGRLTLSVA
jgi:predicted XRE-type DNA-binding protein